MLFGVGTSDHQCEAYDPRWPDDVDCWEQAAPQKRLNVVARGTATEFWDRYPEDIKRAADLGCKLFRFSTSWARIEDSMEHWHEANLRHYADVADCVRENGMEPVVTLLHGAWPLHVEQHGSLHGRDFPDRFACYAGKVAEALRGKVRYWITINETSMLSFCYLKPPRAPRYPRAPGLRPRANVADQLNAVGELIPNLFLANARAYDAIHGAAEDCQVSANPYILGIPDQWFDAIKEAVDDEVEKGHGLGVGHNHKVLWNAAHLLFRHRRGVSTLAGASPSAFNGTLWHLGIAGRLDSDICPPECRGKQDFVAFDYYWGIGRVTKDLHRVGPLLTGRYDQAPVYAGALYRLLTYLSGLFPVQPIWLVENGCVETAAGITRNQYLTDHLEMVKRAEQDGVPVAAYILWSITTNREWGLLATPATDFGLYTIDLDLIPGEPGYQVRRKTESVDLYRSLIKNWS